MGFTYFNASQICWQLPAPPDAITGILTDLEIASVNLISYPSLVPSLSIEVNKISPAPNWVKYLPTLEHQYPQGNALHE